jgi:antirestriction protein ArdC
MTKERFDIHQHITDKIVNAIERGAGDFRLPWLGSGNTSDKSGLSRWMSAA